MARLARDPVQEKASPEDNQSDNRHVGGVYIENSQLHVPGTIVGRDYIVVNLQFGLLSRRALIGLGIALIGAVCFVIGRLLWPDPMTGVFNVAIADFGQVDEEGASDHGPMEIRWQGRSLSGLQRRWTASQS